MDAHPRSDLTRRAGDPDSTGRLSLGLNRSIKPITTSSSTPAPSEGRRTDYRIQEAFPAPGVLSNIGTLAGWRTFPDRTPHTAGFGNCYAGDAFQLKNGVTTDLGNRPGGFDSQVN